MTDTTPEAVERLAQKLVGWDHCWPARWLEGATVEAAATLRAQQAIIARLTAERDAALAQVAGAYEAAALFCDETAAEALDESGEASRILNVWFKGQARAIRALTPAAATAALDRIKRQARAEGLRAAATICNRSYGDGLGAAHKAILAAAEQEERAE